MVLNCFNPIVMFILVVITQPFIGILFFVTLAGGLKSRAADIHTNKTAAVFTTRSGNYGFLLTLSNMQEFMQISPTHKKLLFIDLSKKNTFLQLNRAAGK